MSEENLVSGRSVVQEQQGFLDPRSQSQDSKLVKWLISVDGGIKEIERTLKGEDVTGYTDNNQPVFEVVRDPLVNKKGVNEIISFLKALNKSVILSDLTESDIDRITKDNTMSFIGLVGQKYKEWGLEECNLDMILMLVEDTIYSTLRRALNGGAINFLKTTTRTTESYNNASANPENKGFFNRILKW